MGVLKEYYIRVQEEYVAQLSPEELAIYERGYEHGFFDGLWHGQ